MVWSIRGGLKWHRGPLKLWYAYLRPHRQLRSTAAVLLVAVPLVHMMLLRLLWTDYPRLAVRVGPNCAMNFDARSCGRSGFWMAGME